MEFISDDEFNTLLAEHQKSLERAIRKDNERFPPMVVVCLRKPGEKEFAKVACGMQVDFSSRDEKLDAFRALGAMAATEQHMKDRGLPMAVFLVSEAWAKKFNENDKHTIDVNKPVHDYADRREMMIIAGRTFDGRNNSAMYGINLLSGKENDENSKIDIELEVVGKSPEAKATDNLLSIFYEGYAKVLKGEKVESKYSVLGSQFPEDEQ